MGLELCLRCYVSPHVARPRFQPAGTQPPSVAPAQVAADGAPQALG
jgi:hypothetical protein